MYKICIFCLTQTYSRFYTYIRLPHVSPLVTALTYVLTAYGPMKIKPLIENEMVNQSINQLSKCLISVSMDSKAHHPVS